MAAELIDAGVDVDDTYRRLYEKVPIEKLRLVSRALERHRADATDGCLTIAYLTDADYAATGASEVHTEGIIDHLRSLNGARVAALVRDKRDGAARKVSLRSVDGAVDVSRIAREMGGGGHARAAGFSTNLEYRELVEFLSAAVRAQL